MRFTEKKTVENGSLLSSFEQKRRSFGSFFSKTGAFWNKTEQVVKRITPAAALEMRVVKEKRLFVEKKNVVFGVRGGKRVGCLGKKRAFVEKTTLVIELEMEVSVGGNWVRLA
ncbi:MAG: hypothetical protein ACYTEL_08175 [Planctomycetota bacterium]